jgi:hypothetical protein
LSGLLIPHVPALVGGAFAWNDLSVPESLLGRLQRKMSRAMNNNNNRTDDAPRSHDLEHSDARCLPVLAALSQPTTSRLRAAFSLLTLICPPPHNPRVNRRIRWRFRIARRPNVLRRTTSNSC